MILLQNKKINVSDIPSLRPKNYINSNCRNKCEYWSIFKEIIVVSLTKKKKKNVKVF